jgi:hypothetical protein
MKDLKLSALESSLIVCKEMKVKRLVVEKIELEDHVITSNLVAAGSKIKQLYESQSNTNCLTDNLKNKITEQEDNFDYSQELIKVRKPTVTKLSLVAPNLSDNEVSMFIKNGTLCFKANINGDTRYFEANEVTDTFQ